MADESGSIDIIPEDVWRFHILPRCGDLGLRRLGGVSRTLRAYSTAYLATKGYGVRLAVSAIASLRKKMLKYYFRCESNVINQCVEAYLARICVLCNPDALATSAVENVSRTAEEIIRAWPERKLARFLLLLSSRIHYTKWLSADHAMEWGLRKSGYPLLRYILTAPAPHAALLECGQTPRYRSRIAHLVASFYECRVRNEDLLSAMNYQINAVFLMIELLSYIRNHGIHS